MRAPFERKYINKAVSLPQPSAKTSLYVSGLIPDASGMLTMSLYMENVNHGIQPSEQFVCELVEHR